MEQTKIMYCPTCKVNKDDKGVCQYRGGLGPQCRACDSEVVGVILPRGHGACLCQTVLRIPCPTHGADPVLTAAHGLREAAAAEVAWYDTLQMDAAMADPTDPLIAMRKTAHGPRVERTRAAIKNYDAARGATR